jgi:hypothetical protein
MASIRKVIEIDVPADNAQFLWITDVLPDELAPATSELMDRGIGVIKLTLESAAAPG